ncbi:MAG: LamG domain-containing protein [Sedimentisphaerales bacterium]|nr:LamG domain-containing protein [Sedimentisphaerales bacterium]
MARIINIEVEDSPRRNPPLVVGNQLSVTHRKGVALLVVLFVVMVIVVTSIGFLSKSDVELACGGNMELWTEMVYTSESGLEEARGLIMSPQEIGSEYWTGGAGRQIAGGDDYYDVRIVRDDSDPTDRCNYTIDCNSYRLQGGEKVGRNNVTAQLRLDPCIAYWVGTGDRMSRRITINGDMYCAGIVGTQATINGDVFAKSTISGAGIEGKSNQYVTEAPVDWPGIEISDYSPSYYLGVGSYSSENIGSSVHPIGTFNPSSANPGGIRYYTSNAELPGGVNITGMLAIGGDLRVSGVNVISAVKNFPALLVTGDLIIEPGGALEVNGLALAGGEVEISSDGGLLDIAGALFTKNGISETVVDSSGNGRGGVMASDIAWAPAGGYSGGGALDCDGLNDEVIDSQAGSYLNGLSAITVSVWVKSDVTSENRGILYSCQVTDVDSDLGIRYDKAGVYGGGVNGIKASLRATSGYTQIESSSNMQTTNWQHLALVWQSGSSLKLYINGVLNPLRYSSGAVSGVTTGVTKLILGSGAKRKFWDGLLDDLRIYNRVLDPNEIYPPVDGLSGLLTHWRLDEAGCDVDITAAPCKTALMTWSADGLAEKWEQVGGAFFRSIGRRE